MTSQEERSSRRGASLSHCPYREGRFFSAMVRRCVAYGCSNTTADGVSLFHFPKDPVQRRIWTERVSRTRDRWASPSEHSLLCSSHFAPDCFDVSSALYQDLGIGKKTSLKPNAVPTIFQRPVSSLRPPSTTKVRGAFRKRQRARVSL